MFTNTKSLKPVLVPITVCIKTYELRKFPMGLSILLTNILGVDNLKKERERVIIWIYVENNSNNVNKYGLKKKIESKASVKKKKSLQVLRGDLPIEKKKSHSRYHRKESINYVT